MVTAPPSRAPRSGKIRVLFINDTSRNGGPGRTLYYILKFLDPEVIHRTVLVPREGMVADLMRQPGICEELIVDPGLVENIVEPWDRAIARDDFRAHPSQKVVRASGNVVRGALFMKRLMTRVRDDRYDLVFCNGTSACFIGGALAKFTGVSALWHVFYTSVAPAIAPLHRSLAAHPGVRSIICVSKPTTRLFSHCAYKVRVVHDAIDIEEFDEASAAPVLRKELGLSPETVVFGSQGRILPRKGYLEMTRAAKLVLDSLPPDQRPLCQFVVLGDTPEDMRPDHLEECRAEVRRLDLESNVHFIGFRPDVRPYVQDFDVAVVPSVYEDPLPRSVIESMTMKKPVVAFDVGGIGEMVEDGVSGALVRGAPPDIEGLAKAMLRYFESETLRRDHGAAARARVHRDLDARPHSIVLQDEMLRAAGR